MSAAMGFFPRVGWLFGCFGLTALWDSILVYISGQNEFKIAVVNKPLEFEPLKFYCTLSGCVAQSVGHLTRKSGVLSSIPGLATYFHFSFRFFKKGSCQLLAKVCARSTG